MFKLHYSVLSSAFCLFPTSSLDVGQLIIMTLAEPPKKKLLEQVCEAIRLKHYLGGDLIIYRVDAAQKIEISGKME